MGGIPLVMVIVFLYRFWRAKRKPADITPDED